MDPKEELIVGIKNKIKMLEHANEDIWISYKEIALNEIAISKHYETLANLLISK